MNPSKHLGWSIVSKICGRTSGFDVRWPDQHTCVYRSASSLSLRTAVLRPARHLQLSQWVATMHATAAKMGWLVGLDGVWPLAGFWLNGQLHQVPSRPRMAPPKLAAMQTLRTFLAGLSCTPGCGIDVPANHRVFQVRTARSVGLRNDPFAKCCLDVCLGVVV